MKKPLKCVMLVDDNPNDNFFHTREIKKHDPSTIVITMENGPAALEYLKANHSPGYLLPDIIFLDINMPGMNGWEFLVEYHKLEKALHSGMIIVMLTTSEGMEEAERAIAWKLITDFCTKPLTKEKIGEIISRHFA
jgi:CheY-like chemotaxis protein